MRLYIKFILPFLLTQILSNVMAQQGPEVYTAYYNRIAPVTFELSKIPYGIIQWQESDDGGITWNDISDANVYKLDYTTETSMMVRALVMSGTCDTIISQISALKTLKVLTEKVDSITDLSAVIFCELDTGDIQLSEYGLLYDNNQSVDENSDRISFYPPVDTFYSVKLDQITAGVTYYARAFGKSENDDYIFGNILEFTPIKVTFAGNLNVTVNEARVRYEVTGLDISEVEEHGIFINTVPGSLNSADTVYGTLEDGELIAVADALKAGTAYYVNAFVKTGETNYHSIERKIITWSDYDEPVDTTIKDVAYKIEWNDESTAIKLNPAGTFGEYGRVERLGNTDTLILAYHGGPNTGDWINIYMRKSYDNGTTWTPQETLMALADYPGQYWRFCTPEILSLQNGWVMVAYEANARPDENQSSVQILISKDSTQTWEEPIIYKTGRSWEPSMVQLPHGEIELFFSSEAKWWPGEPVYQDIQVIRSTDNGLSWSDPQVVAYYPEKRDGMPVPIVLQGNKGVIFTIETVGVGTSPYIVQRDMNGPWILTTSDFENSPHRWLANGFSAHGGAPYMLQLPSGEVVMSAHIYRGGDWHQNNYQEVRIGDNNAKNFQGSTYPWNLQWGESAVNNSLFLKNDTTIVTISTRMFSNSTGGLYWLEGTIVPIN